MKAMERIETKGLTVTNKVEEIMEEWKKRSNSVYAFVKTCTERDPHSIIPKDDVYSTYTLFCDNHDLNALPKNKFSQELQRLVPIRETRKKIAGKITRCWQGIKLKCDECKKCKEVEEETQEEIEEFVEKDFKEMFEDMLSGG